MTKWFKVSFEVPEDRLETFVALVKGEIRDLKIEQCIGTGRSTLPVSSSFKLLKAPKRRKQWVPDINIGVGKIIWDLALQGRPFDGKQVENLAMLKGFKRNSSSSAVSLLVKQGLLSIVNPGCRPYQYAMADKGLDYDAAERIKEALSDDTAH